MSRSVHDFSSEIQLPFHASDVGVRLLVTPNELATSLILPAQCQSRPPWSVVCKIQSVLLVPFLFKTAASRFAVFSRAQTHWIGIPWAFPAKTYFDFLKHASPLLISTYDAQDSASHHIRLSHLIQLHCETPDEFRLHFRKRGPDRTPFAKRICLCPRYCPPPMSKLIVPC